MPDDSVDRKSVSAPSWSTTPDLPIHTVGECRGSRNCGQFAADLADGWCVQHWDMGHPMQSGRDRRKPEVIE